jgi:hypothetical protein
MVAGTAEVLKELRRNHHFAANIHEPHEWPR